MRIFELLGINTWPMAGHSRGKEKKEREAWENLENQGKRKKIKGKPYKLVRDTPPKH